MALELRDQNGKLKTSVIAVAIAGLVGLFWLLARNSSTSGQVANGQSSDITGLLGGLQDAIDKLANTPPPVTTGGGGSGGVGYTGPPVVGGGTGTGGGGSGVGQVGPPVTGGGNGNYVPPPSTGHASNPTSKQSPIVTTLNSYPIAAKTFVAPLGASTAVWASVPPAQNAVMKQTQIKAFNVQIDTEAAATAAPKAIITAVKAPITQGGTGTATSGSKAV